jgi:hypothetical protein
MWKNVRMFLVSMKIASAHFQYIIMNDIQKVSFKFDEWYSRYFMDDLRLRTNERIR